MPEATDHPETPAVSLSPGQCWPLFERHPAIMLLLEPASGVIRNANPAACAFYGYAVSELRRLCLADLTVQQPDVPLASLLTPAQLPGAPVRFQQRQRSGDLRQVEVFCGVVGAEPEALLHLVVHDLTDRRDRADELRQLQNSVEVLQQQLDQTVAHANQLALQAHAAQRAKADFLAIINHEIRTPLNGVIGLTGLLLDSELTPSQRQFAEMVRVSADALLTVVNDLLDFSKLEAGQVEMEKLDFDLPGLVRDTAGLLEHQAQQKRLKFTCRIDPAIPGTVTGDPGHLRQVLVSLVGNAIKFTPLGEITLAVEATAVTPECAQVRFVVTDTGPGISPARLDCLFKPFSQIDPATTRKHSGLGLGLAASKHLVELMGGQIGVESLEGEGSTFWFNVAFQHHAVVEFPVEIQAAIDRQEQAHQNRPRVLVADDNLTYRTMVAGMLKRLGLRVDAVANGHEVLLALETIPYDLILMDVHMPVMDGFEATRRLRDPRTPVKHHEVPVIAMATYTRNGEWERCLEAGMSAIVSKPVQLQNLTEVIQAFLPIGENATQPAAEPIPIAGPLRLRAADDKVTWIRVSSTAARADAASRQV